LKDRLRETLKELKTGTNNEENPEKAILQNLEVFIQLQSTDGHAMRNVIKKRQFFIDSYSSRIEEGIQRDGTLQDGVVSTK
jgi:hypothetical protein